MTVPHPELLEARCFLGFPIRNHVIPIPLTLNLKYINRVNSEETVVLRWWESITGNLVLSTKLITLIGHRNEFKR